MLQKKIDNFLPIPFISTKDNQLIIVIENTDAIEIKFKELIDVQMGWFYFEVDFINNAPNPLQKWSMLTQLQNVFFYLLSVNAVKLVTRLCLAIG